MCMDSESAQTQDPWPLVTEISGGAGNLFSPTRLQKPNARPLKRRENTPPILCLPGQ